MLLRLFSHQAPAAPHIFSGGGQNQFDCPANEGYQNLAVDHKSVSRPSTGKFTRPEFTFARACSRPPLWEPTVIYFIGVVLGDPLRVLWGGSAE